MLLARINGESAIYYNHEQFIIDTFSPSTVYEYIQLGAIKGKTYKEKKETAREKAVDYSMFDCLGLSWGECSIISDYFEKIAKRYGLIKEFRENGII